MHTKSTKESNRTLIFNCRCACEENNDIRFLTFPTKRERKVMNHIILALLFSIDINMNSGATSLKLFFVKLPYYYNVMYLFSKIALNEMFERHCSVFIFRCISCIPFTLSVRPDTNLWIVEAYFTIFPLVKPFVLIITGILYVYITETHRPLETHIHTTHSLWNILWN